MSSDATECPIETAVREAAQDRLSCLQQMLQQLLEEQEHSEKTLQSLTSDALSEELAAARADFAKVPDYLTKVRKLRRKMHTLDSKVKSLEKRSQAVTKKAHYEQL
ncbi:MAG: hypothetical protein MHM6MM_004832 [Cercozoa sp. M6MM]